MARAMILPFGPSLVYRLVYSNEMYDNGNIPLVNESGVAYYFAMVVSVYIFGRWLGANVLTNVLQNYISLSHRRNAGISVYVARLGGFSLSLHVFTYGAGLTSVRWLIVIRFFSAILAGMLCGVTNRVFLPEDDWVYRSNNNDDIQHSYREERIEALRRREGYIDIASGTAKIYLTGFAVSILSGGLLFRKATKDSTFRALTGAEKYTLSPMFLISVAVSSEFVLRKLFTWSMSHQATFVNTNEKMVSVDTEITKRNSIGTVRKRTFSTSKPTYRQQVIGEDESSFEGGDDSIHLLDVSSRMRLDSLTSLKDSSNGRIRCQSETSLDDFYDCHSVLSEVEGGFSFTRFPEMESTEKVSEIASYKDGRVTYSDGSPAYVPHGDCIGKIPSNYIDFYNGNTEKASRAWDVTQCWRKNENVWQINSRRNTWFSSIKEAYPHFVHGRSKNGYVVIYEQPGKMNLRKLFQTGCNVSDMVLHYIFFMEFVSNIVCKQLQNGDGTSTKYDGSSSWGTLVVMDVKGASLTHLSGDVLKYLKQAGEINSAHYPNNMKRAFLVNSPFWLAGAWSGIKSILPESVQVEILSEKGTLAKLNEYIDLDQIPPEYGGSSPYMLGEHPFEIELRSIVESVKDNDGKEKYVIDSQQQDKVQRPMDIYTPITDRALNNPNSTDSGCDFLEARFSPPMNPERPRYPSIDYKDRFRDRTYEPMMIIESNGLDVPRDRRRDEEVFFIVSGIHVLFSFVQGAMEMGIPLWMLCPTSIGGLGYSPSKSGVSLFCAATVLLWTLRKKPSRLVSRIPGKEPLRAFRIGAGSQSALFTLLGLLSYLNA